MFPDSYTETEVVAKTLMDNFFSKFGCPLELHTDQGKNMDGNLIRQLCELLQIAKTRTTPYHPSSNGQIERYNRTILQTIRCFIQNKQHNWDIHLQQLVSAIRSTTNIQTGFTPNLMMLGREVFQPIDILLGTARLQSEGKEAPQYVKDLIATLNVAHTIARENLKIAQERQKRTHDIYNNKNSYNVGNVVYKLNQATKTGQSSKLKSPWKGPYIITEVRTPVLYKIKDRKRESWVHHDRLKLCQDREFPVWIRRMRNGVLKNHNLPGFDDKSEEELTESPNLSSLFDEFTSNVGASDLLVSHTDSEDDFLGTPVPLVSQSISQGASSERDRQIVGSLQELENFKGLDDTLIYCVEEEDEVVSTSRQTGKRNRKAPLYLKDYVQD